MSILDSILKKWNAERDLENLISSGFFTNKDAIQLELEKLSGDKKNNALSTLGDIQSALQIYLGEMEKNISEVKSQIDTTHKSEKACLSYGSSVDIQNNKKD